jgi:hypothetical protein
LESVGTDFRINDNGIIAFVGANNVVTTVTGFLGLSTTPKGIGSILVLSGFSGTRLLGIAEPIITNLRAATSGDQIIQFIYPPL